MSVQLCCLPCCHVFLISLFLGAMTSSPVILDTAIVRPPRKDWAGHHPCSPNKLGWESQLAGPNLTWARSLWSILLQEPPLLMVTLRSRLTVPREPSEANSSQYHTHCCGRGRRLCPQGSCWLLVEAGGSPDPMVRGASRTEGSEAPRSWQPGLRGLEKAGGRIPA